MADFENALARAVLKTNARLLRLLVQGIDGLLSKLVGPLAKPISAAVREIALAPLGIDLEDSVRRALIDQRLAKLDTARVALEESLSAIHELQEEGLKARVEHESAKVRLEKVLASKGDAEKQLAEVRAFYQRDIGTFRQLAGTPNMAVERTVSFLLGILASIVASLVWNWRSVYAWFSGLAG